MQVGKYLKFKSMTRLIMKCQAAIPLAGPAGVPSSEGPLVACWCPCPSSSSSSQSVWLPSNIPSLDNISFDFQTNLELFCKFRKWRAHEVVPSTYLIYKPWPMSRADHYLLTFFGLASKRSIRSFLSSSMSSISAKSSGFSSYVMDSQ